MNNLNMDKLAQLLSTMPQGDKIKKALGEKDYKALISSLPPEEAQKLSSVMADKSALDRLLSSPEAVALIKALSDGTKR